MESPQSSQNIQPKIGLALSGGVAIGLAHVGVLQVLKENNIPIDCISGTSAGALIAALFAFGVPMPQIEKEPLRLTGPKFLPFPRSKMSISHNKAVGDLITSILGYKPIERRIYTAIY